MESIRETNHIIVDGKYKIIKKIGSGAFGVIYKGKLPSLLIRHSPRHSEERRSSRQV